MVAKPTPHYLPALAEAIKDGRLPVARGKVNHAFVSHDDWCAIFKGGVCDCDPEVASKPAAPPSPLPLDGTT